MGTILLSLLIVSQPATALDLPLTLQKVKDHIEAVNSDADPGNDIHTVDALLSQLPQGILKNPLFMIHSRSLQAATIEQPRVILKAYLSKFLMTFNTKPGSAGYKTMEMIQWDETDLDFKFGEIVFSSAEQDPSPSGPVKISIDQTSPEIKKCTACHTSSLRPNWDTYNFWSGLTPYNHDTLYKDSKDTQIYRAIVDKVKAGEVRLRHLRLPTAIMDGSAFQSSYNVPHYLNDSNSVSNEGPSVDLFDELTDLNHMRIAKLLSLHPSFPKIKYAALGAVSNCNVTEFLPPQYVAAANAYFNMDYAAVVSATGQLQTNLFHDKQTRHKAILGITDLGSVANKEISLNMVGPLRWVVEPFGVPMKYWSLSIDPGTYTFADLFSGFRYQLTKYVKSSTCDELKKLSLEALAQ